MQKHIRKKLIGYIGLGKMGINMALRLGKRGYKVVAFNRGAEKRRTARARGLVVTDSLDTLVSSLRTPRVLWLMVSHTGVDEILTELLPLLARGDVIIDGGNCFYKDTIRRAQLLKRKGIAFLDAGVSGGPSGALSGACIMVGGDRNVYKRLEPLFASLVVLGGLSYVGKSGAGHFTKMVHNGIEYGMMQALAEGFSVLKASPFRLDVKEIARLYNHGSVIESRLVGWIESAFRRFGSELRGISSSVAHTGEGEWTVKTAKKLGVRVKVIEVSLQFRKESHKKPSFSGKTLTALRNQFGGHSIKLNADRR